MNKELIYNKEIEVIIDGKVIKIVPNNVMEQFEKIKNNGKINMFDAYGAQREAFDCEYFDFVKYMSNDIGKYSEICTYYKVWNKRK